MRLAEPRCLPCLKLMYPFEHFSISDIQSSALSCAAAAGISGNHFEISTSECLWGNLFTSCGTADSATVHVGKFMSMVE